MHLQLLDYASHNGLVRVRMRGVVARFAHADSYHRCYCLQLHVEHNKTVLRPFTCVEACDFNVLHR